jgi:serine/threonine protein kinase/tetratricopeptide (TPR) repeat protein
MSEERWQTVEGLFHAALERPREQRQAWLDGACSEDAELRRQVELLLSNEERAGSFLERPAIEDVRVTQTGAGSLLGRKFGPYEIVSPLGAGGMGEVYRAHDSKLGRDVAIKTLPYEFAGDPERLARFRREARTLASLNHPNIAAIYGFEESGEVDCLVLELVEGETLRGPLPVAQALDRARQVAEALEAAHAKGIIHRDLKPSNVKVTPQGRVKVLDFGLAKAIWGPERNQDLSPAASENGSQSLPGHIVGTPGYMSPEQASGADVDERADIWAFGCLLYELLTGQRAFSGESSQDTIAAVLEREPDWDALPAKTPAKVRELLRQCLQKDAGRRLQHIADARRTIEEVQSAPENVEAERKTVTALLADFKGSMGLIEDLDPEELRAIVDPALKLMIDAVHHYDGYVTRSTDDGIFALFGAPVAHEDHPQRALSAALRMQAEVKRYAERLRAEKGLNMQVRVGANTGEVVMREIRTGEKHTEYGPIGSSISVTASVQMLVAPGSIAITESVRKLVEGFFTLKSLGPVRINGVSEPLEIYEVTGPGPLRTRFQRAAARGYTRFVGRRREMEMMKNAAESAKMGRGQIVAVVAEPGVGKSRLLLEFKATSQDGWLVLEGVSFSHGKTSAYLPLVELLHDYFGIEPDDEPWQRREKVAGKVTMLDRSLDETLPYLFGLLGIVEGRDPHAGMDEQIRRRRTQEAVKRIFLRESLNQPLMLIFEDLHLIDDATQGFLNLLTEGIASASVLLLVNYRPEYTHQSSSKTYYTHLRLDPLSKDSAAEMLSARIGDSPDLAPVKRLILERTEGNPLFIEELVEALFDEGVLVRNGAVKLTRPLSQLKIPPIVQGILAARIDRLPPHTKELLQTLAVIGSQFPLALVRQVVQLPVDGLDPLLDVLQAGEFIYERPVRGDVEYTFKHALTHDAAYNSQLTERRKLLHERTAQAIEAVYSERLEDHYADLAYHYRSSDNSAKAVEYCLSACQQSMDRASYAEAIGHFDYGLARLHELPDDDRRAELELDLRNAARGAIITTKGVTEAEQFALRACELSQRPGVHSDKAWRALKGLYATAQTRGGVGRLHELGAQLLAIAEQSGNVDFTAESFHRIAFTHLVAGDFELAAKSFERSVSLFETTTSQPSLAWRRSPSHAHAYAVSAWNSWFLGFPDRALKLLDNALAVARASDSKAAEELVRSLSAQVFLHRRDLEQTRQSASAAIALATELGDPFRRALGEVYLGWSDSLAQDPREGLARMRRALTDLGRTGSLTQRSQWLLLIAEVQCLLGQHDNASVAIDDALASIEQTGERAYEAEACRTKGELLRAKGSSNAPQAEQSFRTAIEIARRQKARGWELRATTSLARLLRDTNRREEARAMLADIYNWFTEGFGTADLKVAKLLLEELN